LYVPNQVSSSAPLPVSRRFPTRLGQPRLDRRPALSAQALMRHATFTERGVVGRNMRRYARGRLYLTVNWLRCASMPRGHRCRSCKAALSGLLAYGQSNDLDAAPSLPFAAKPAPSSPTTSALTAARETEGPGTSVPGPFSLSIYTRSANAGSPPDIDVARAGHVLVDGTRRLGNADIAGARHRDLDIADFAVMRDIT